MLYPYRESLISQLYPGWQHSSNCLQPAVEAFERRLNLPPEHRRKIVWRLDGGFGGDQNVEYLLGRGYHVLAKGASNRQAAKLAAQVKRWRALRADKVVGQVPTPEPFSRPVQTFVTRTQIGQRTRLAYLYSTLPGSGVQTARLYDQRGGAETEFRADKSGGGHLHKRRKHKRDAQEVWIHLTDMAHNYFSWFAGHLLADSRFEGYGPLRISRDLMRVPGLVEIRDAQLLSVKLLKSSPYARDLLACLERFWE
jgi:hypothetical protein